MSITLDSRAGARRAEAVALLAADAACDAYRETLDESLRDSVSPEHVIAEVRGGPGDALASAVADLGSVAFAAARAAHLAAEAASLEDVRRAGELAESAASAARAGAMALGASGGDLGAMRVIELCHIAALTAHRSADALAAFEAAGGTSLPSGRDHPAVPFPPAWRARIERTAERVGAMRRRIGDDADEMTRDLLDAADAASAAAVQALRAYERSGHGNGVSRAIGRVTRIAALAACYASGAALDVAT